MVESLTFSLRFLNPTMYQELLEKLKKKKEKKFKKPISGHMLLHSGLIGLG